MSGRFLYVVDKGAGEHMNIVLSATLRAQIHNQLKATYPNEGGGFLLGSRSADTIDIADVIAIENVFEAEEQYHRYAMTPQDWMRLEDEADARGLTLVGYFHSHPDSPAVPSEYDREHALPNFVYIIVQVQAGAAVDTRGWLLAEDRTRFHEVGLHIVS